MPAFASRSAIVAAKTRGQDARDAQFIGSVTIAGRIYSCELHTGNTKLEQSADGSGFAYVQRVTVKIRKVQMLTAPPRDTAITIGSDLFTIAGVAGQSGHEPAWVIEAMRLPPSA